MSNILMLVESPSDAIIGEGQKEGGQEGRGGTRERGQERKEEEEEEEEGELEEKTMEMRRKLIWEMMVQFEVKGEMRSLE